MFRSKWLRLLLFVPLLVASMSMSAVAADSKSPRILAIGDSLMAWNKGSGRSIGHMVGRYLGEPVEVRAVTGARIVYGLPISGSMGMNISKQLRPGPYDWVIISGGGNDLWFGCGCNKCDGRMNRMVAADGRRGDVVNLVARIRKSGARVVVIGYLRSPGVGSVIESCRDDGDAYEARLKKMAGRMKGVYFLSNAKLVPRGDRSYHSGDMIHPSVKGSAAIGKRVAALIRKVDRTR